MVHLGYRKERGIKMDRPIYICGHQNPDTDSICAAIAYANLKKLLGEKKVIATRLGNINHETEYVLEYFDVPPPELIDNVKPQIRDLEMPEISPAQTEESIYRTLEKIIDQRIHSLPVVDREKRLFGIVSISDIAPLYLGKKGDDFLKEGKTPFLNIVDVLDGIIVQGKDENLLIKGKFVIFTGKNKHELRPEDIVICENEPELIEQAVESKVECLIIADSQETDGIDLPIYSNQVVVTVPHSIFEIVYRIPRAIPIKEVVKAKNIEYFEIDDYVEDIKETMIASPHRRFPVIDGQRIIRGTISKSDFFNLKRKRVILVDHNEKGQSVKGIEDAEIMEIIDHHRISDVRTMAPLYFRAEPLGSTCTIIAKLYEEYHCEMDRKMAGIMLSAILSDTLIFHSPTATKEDEEIAHRLAEIAGVDLQQYGMDMIIAGTSLDNESAESILYKDLKRFVLGKYNVIVSQINTGDFSGVLKQYDEIKQTMEDICVEEKIDLVVLMITDITVNGTEIVIHGPERWIAQKAFHLQETEESIFLPNVFSRKKQIIPPLMNIATF